MREMAYKDGLLYIYDWMDGFGCTINGREDGDIMI
jgi:hypothetical protein